MKRKFAALILLFIAAAVCLLPGSADAASLKGKTLKAGRTYRINLNGGKKKEKVKYTIKKNADYTQVFSLYVNGKRVFRQIPEDSGAVISVKALDLNTGDKYTELLVDVAGDASNWWVFLLRYVNPKKLTAVTEFAGYKDPMSPASVGRISSEHYKNTGKNRLYLENETPFSNRNFGCFYILAPVKLKNSKITFLQEKNYKLTKVKDYAPGLFGGNYYKLKASMTLYAGPSMKKTIGTLEAGDTFVPTYIRPLKPVTETYEGEEYYSHPLVVKVKTADGKSGWLYFPPKSIDGNGSDYLTATPSWG